MSRRNLVPPADSTARWHPDTGAATTLPARLVRAIAVVLIACASAGVVERITFSPADFGTWEYFRGLVTVEGNAIRVRRFGGGFNAVADADEFHSQAVGAHGSATLRAGSGAGTARRVGDQRSGTWWQPAPGDPVEKWWIELDLGRTVVASQVALVVPDRRGARP